MESSSKPKRDVTMSPLLEVHDLYVQFPTRRGIVKAVDGISFDVSAGEIVGIVGESGSGKSMTARSILRIVPKPGKVVGGDICLNGVNLTELSDSSMSKVRGKQVAMVFQEPGAALNPVLTVGEQVEEVLATHHGLKGEAARNKAIEHLREVGIPAAKERYKAFPHQLSGGMKQRCVIAIALACNPQLLIADEPTTALDVTIQAQILSLLVDLTRERNMGLIFITHNIAAVAQIAQRIMVMYAGKIVEVGATGDVIDNPKHPYTKALLQAMPTMKVRYGERLQEIKGRVPDLANVPPGCAFHPRCPAVMDRCRTDTPTLLPIGPDRLASCWLHSESQTAEGNHDHH